MIRRKEEGESSSAVARALKISVRRVNQVWQEYRETGIMFSLLNRDLVYKDEYLG